MRHPQDVLRSWVQRDKHKQQDWIVRFAMGWALLQELSQTCDCDFVYLEEQNHPEITDWTPVGSKDKKWNDGAEAENISIFSVFRLPIVSEHYRPRPLKDQP